MGYRTTGGEEDAVCFRASVSIFVEALAYKLALPRTRRKVYVNIYRVMMPRARSPSVRLSGLKS